MNIAPPWLFVPAVLLLAATIGAVAAAAYSAFGADATTQGQAFGEPVYGAERPSDEQLAALADGHVSRDEMIQALNRAADCIEAEGLQAVRPGHPQLEGNLVFMRFTPEGVDPAVGADAFRRCSERHSANLSSKYQVQLEAEGRAAPRPE